MKKYNALLFLIPLALNFGCKPKMVESSNKQEEISLPAQEKNQRDYKDSTVYKYKNYKVVVSPIKDDSGENIFVFDKNNKLIFKNTDYFVDLVDHYLIIDEGTTAYRGLTIYDLEKIKAIFSAGYDGVLDIKGNLVNFWTEVSLANSLKPKCPESNIEYNGFVELQTFDLNQEKLLHTGEYKCAYFE